MLKYRFTFGWVNNSIIEIKDDVDMLELAISVFNSNAKLEVGEDCQISYGVKLFHSDAHPIYDEATGKLINYVKDMRIGKHYMPKTLKRVCKIKALWLTRCWTALTVV
ncbi:MAG: hypothetical protein LBU55_01720 [Elusimicrobiota bacterium]|nr:hypothetical protein [Elusimicrobiota bacterium]